MQRHFSTIIGVLLVLFGTVWFFFAAPQMTRLSTDFRYQANLFSIDNLYDQELGDFAGEEVSSSIFSHRTNQAGAQTRSITNSFTVRTLEGDTIFEVDRQYTIDAVSREHISGALHGERSGTLFAPPLNDERPFTYWHVNYNTPIEMQFDRAEVINGLDTNVFTGNFVVDQTKELSGLPDVPEKYAMETIGTIQLWIEPVSGYLVKYSDTATVNYVDVMTGELHAPWNTFVNTYAKQSVPQQTEKARAEKVRFVIHYGVIPITLLGFGIISLLLQGRRKWIRIVGYVLVVGVAGGVYFWNVQPRPVEPVRIGIVSWVESPDIRNNINAFKADLGLAGYVEGVNVEFIEMEASAAQEATHRNSVQRLIDADVDLIYSLTTSGTLIVQDMVGEEVPIVFSIVTYPVEVGLVESLRYSGNRTTGSRSWVSIEQQLRTFRELVPNATRIGFVHREGEPNSEIQLKNIRRAGEQVGVEIVSVAADTTEDIAQQLRTLHGDSDTSFDALYAACDTLVQAQGGVEAMISFAVQHNIPDFSCNISAVPKGMLMALSADFADIGRIAAEKAGEILSGVPAGVIEVSTSIRPILYINADTADRLGITIPQELLTSADRIVR